MLFLIVLAGWIFSLCLHEFAHAAVAYAGGDTTVRQKGYLSFNPLRYADPMLSLALPLFFLLLGGLGLPGGAVYIERWRLRGRFTESAVSLAGPLANLLLAVALAIPFRFNPALGGAFWSALAFLGLLQVSALMLNLLPIPPLDGYGAIAPHLGASTRAAMNHAGGQGILVLFLLLSFVPPLNRLFWSLVFGLTGFLGIPVATALEGLRGFRFWD